MAGFGKTKEAEKKEAEEDNLLTVPLEGNRRSN